MNTRIPHLAAAFLLAFTLTACGTVTRLQQAGQTLFTAAKLADLKLVGVKTGPAIPLQATPAASATPANTAGPADPAADATRQTVTQLLGQGPVGVLLPITEVGKTTPWWIFCPAGAMQSRCEEIPPNARVTFAGQPLGRGTVLLPTRLTWSQQ
jgi:hypothetical protein